MRLWLIKKLKPLRKYVNDLLDLFLYKILGISQKKFKTYGKPVKTVIIIILIASILWGAYNWISDKKFQVKTLETLEKIENESTKDCRISLDNWNQPTGSKIILEDNSLRIKHHNNGYIVLKNRIPFLDSTSTIKTKEFLPEDLKFQITLKNQQGKEINYILNNGEKYKFTLESKGLEGKYKDEKTLLNTKEISVDYYIHGLRILNSKSSSLNDTPMNKFQLQIDYSNKLKLDSYPQTTDLFINIPESEFETHSNLEMYLSIENYNPDEKESRLIIPFCSFSQKELF